MSSISAQEREQGHRVVAALRSLGLGARAARISRCGPPDPSAPGQRWCADRLCPMCARGWVHRHHARKLALAAVASSERTVYFGTLKTSGASASSAMEKHTRAFKRFNRRFGAPSFGAHHLSRSGKRGWLAHAHILAAFPDTTSDTTVVETLRTAWASAGGKIVPWAERARSVGGSLRYALEGAVVRNVSPYPVLTVGEGSG